MQTHFSELNIFFDHSVWRYRAEEELHSGGEERVKQAEAAHAIRENHGLNNRGLTLAFSGLVKIEVAARAGAVVQKPGARQTEGSVALETALRGAIGTQATAIVVARNLGAGDGEIVGEILVSLVALARGNLPVRRQAGRAVRREARAALAGTIAS